jgi:hypothetical protein
VATDDATIILSVDLSAAGVVLKTLHKILKLVNLKNNINIQRAAVFGKQYTANFSVSENNC